MNGDEKLARWAALFVDAYRRGGADAGPAASPGFAADARYPGVTQAASELLHAVDAGGVPAFVSTALRRIAEENGIAAAVGWTPNQIIDALRSKALERGSAGPGDSVAPADQ